MPPAARAFADTTSHPLPPVLSPGPGSANTMIGFMPAWRAVPIAAAAGLAAAKQASDIKIMAAETATNGASGTPAYPGLLATEAALKIETAASLGSSFAATGADKHACMTPSPAAMCPHGTGVVLNASTTVFVNNLPLCRQGDQIIEPVGPPNPISKGELTVIVG